MYKGLFKSTPPGPDMPGLMPDEGPEGRSDGELGESMEGSPGPGCSGLIVMSASDLRLFFFCAGWGEFGSSESFFLTVR